VDVVFHIYFQFLGPKISSIKNNSPYLATSL